MISSGVITMHELSLVDRAIILLDELPRGERFTWNFRQRNLMVNLAEAGGLDHFLQWPVSIEALHAGYTDFAAAERDLIDPDLRPVAKDPLYGNPPGNRSPEKSSGTYIRQLVVALLIDQHLMSIADMEWVFEFGGGYGALAVVLGRLGFEGLHYVYDLPALHLIRDWYLDNMHVKTESITKLYNTVIEDVDVFVSVCSMDEAPLETRTRVLDSARANNYLFWITRMWDGIDNYNWFRDWVIGNGLRYGEVEVPNKNQCCMLAKR